MKFTLFQLMSILFCGSLAFAGVKPELFGLDLSLSKAEIKAAAKARHVTSSSYSTPGENEENDDIDMIGDLTEKTKDMLGNDTVEPIKIVFYKNVVKSLEYKTIESAKFPALGVLNTLEKRFGSFKLLTGGQWYGANSMWAQNCVAVFESPDWVIALEGTGVGMDGEETCKKLKNKDKTAAISFIKLHYDSKTAVKLMNADFASQKSSEEKDRAKKVDGGVNGL